MRPPVVAPARRPPPDLLAAAEAAYDGVLVDAPAHRARAADVVQRARRERVPEALVVGLRALAWAEHVQMDNDSARTLLDQAARTASRHGLQRRLGDVLVSRAAVLHELGRLRAAQADLDRAATLLGSGRSAEVLLQQAALHQNVGRLVQASALYRQVVALPACPPEVLVKVLNNLALVEVHLGAWTAAAEHVDRAAGLADRQGPVLAAIVAQSRAWVTMQVGDVAGSLQRFAEAGRRYEQAGLPRGEHLLEYADALLDLRLLPEAYGAATGAAAALGTSGTGLMAAEAQLRVARLALMAGRPEQARAAGRAALVGLRRQGRTAWVARAEVVLAEVLLAEVAGGHVAAAGGAAAGVAAGEVAAGEVPGVGEGGARVPPAAVRRVVAAAGTLARLGLCSEAVAGHLTAGRLALARGDGQTALPLLVRSYELSRRAPVLVRVRGRQAAALAAERCGQPGQVLRHCGAGLVDLARHRSALPSMELRALASGHGAELGRMGLRAVLPGGRPAQVLDWMDRTRAAALASVDVPSSQGVEAELSGLRAAHADLESARRETGSEPLALVARVSAAEQELRRASWAALPADHVERGRARPAQLRAVLAGAVLVMYGSLDGRLFAALLEPRRTRLVGLGRTSDALAAAEVLRFALRRLTAPRSAPAAVAARTAAEAARSRLVRQVVAPLRLDPAAPVVVVPSAQLPHFPWSALFDGPTALAPSAALWARTAQSPAPAAGRVALLAGPDLPGAVSEVRALAEQHRGARVLLPPASTVAAVTGALQGAGLAHLACHGRLRVDNPTFSALVLSDGLLTVHELALRGSTPHRMVLAACDSGVEVAYDGDEMLGFVSALFAGGTAGLVASSLLVPDLDTVPLMCSLHEHLVPGVGLAAALHRARAGLDRDDPAGFVNWCAWNAYGAG